MQRRTILITGASGRFGRTLAEAWGEKHRIVRMDTRPPEDIPIPSDQRVVTGSITDPLAVAEAMDGVDVVIHSGAIPSDQPPFEELVHTNVSGTFNVLEAAGARAQVEQVIFLSSLCWHGIGLGDPELTRPLYLPIDENHPSVAISPYGMSKVQGELWCQAYVKRFRKPAVALRPGWIVPLEREDAFGPRPPRKRPWLMDYVGTSDVINAIERSMEYNPVDGFDAFLLSGVDHMCELRSVELAELFFPGVPLNRDLLDAYDGYGSMIQTQRARERLGWEPQVRCHRESWVA